MTTTECTTCGANLEETHYAVFPCPQCGDTTIARCDHCRQLKNQYTCRSCGFTGP